MSHPREQVPADGNLKVCGVEIAIEENEAAAVKWIDENLKR